MIILVKEAQGSSIKSIIIFKHINILMKGVTGKPYLFMNRENICIINRIYPVFIL